MCRFLAYLGKKPITMARVIDCPTHSLVEQSRKAQLGKHHLNADGFGIGWYNLNIDPTAGVFKSTQPAWNDQNLHHIASKIRSTCFIGHIRASTVGDVNSVNCHPFSFDNLLFAHNGTITGFDEIKRELLNTLSDHSYFSLHGETDSEHFFALLHNSLHKNFKNKGLNEIVNALLDSIKTINSMQKAGGNGHYMLLNTLVTNGEEMLATRYASSDKEEQNSLFYSLGDYILPDLGEGLMHDIHPKQSSAIVIASEPINEIENEWVEVAENHMLIIDKHLNVTSKAIKV